MTDTAISKKDQHLANCAAAKVEGAARRADKKAASAKAHRAFLDGLIAQGAERKASRIQAHQDRNQASKDAAVAKKAVNDDASEVPAAA